MRGAKQTDGAGQQQYGPLEALQQQQQQQQQQQARLQQHIYDDLDVVSQSAASSLQSSSPQQAGGNKQAQLAHQQQQQQSALSIMMARELFDAQQQQQTISLGNVIGGRGGESSEKFSAFKFDSPKLARWRHLARPTCCAPVQDSWRKSFAIAVASSRGRCLPAS